MVVSHGRKSVESLDTEVILHELYIYVFITSLMLQRLAVCYVSNSLRLRTFTYNKANSIFLGLLHFIATYRVNILRK